MRLYVSALLIAMGTVSCTTSNDAAHRSSDTVAVRPETDTDTLRGRLALVGSDPFPRWVLQAEGGDVQLTGELLRGVQNVSGLEVWVSGSLRPDRREMEVGRLAVRALDGVAATDGILHVDAGEVALVTSDGRRLTVANPPPDLRSHDGAWVWIAGELEAEPMAYGVIRPQR